MRKGVYLYNYMDEWGKFNETSLPEKEDFYSNQNMEEITNPGYMHAKRACKNFEIKNLSEYHDFYFNPNKAGLFEGSFSWGKGEGGSI